ncbi:MAG: UDP-N-acetylglucosamine 2-epimerase (non-hydrolyzing), partial [Bacteroidota bacterium]
MKVALIDKQLKVLSYDPAKIHGAGFLVKRNTQEQLKVLSDDPAKIHGAGFLVKRKTQEQLKVLSYELLINNPEQTTQNSKFKIQHLICHTGQHYDEKMSKVFFEELEMPKPDYYLGIGSGSHAEQTGKVMIEFEKVLIQEKPDLVIVVGDVNSTIACSLTAVKLGIKVAHVEAGLRSLDKNMPEEVNRILTDSISDYLFVSEPDGIKNLRKEGKKEEEIIFVGNTMIDSLVNYLPKINVSNIIQNLELIPQNYILVTFHRPSNVDSEKNLNEIIILLNKLAEQKKVVFPVHPRTRNKINENKLSAALHKNIILTEPIGYIDFISLIKNCSLVITDSGGIQEETTFLGVQCITTRKTTERPITV